MTTIEFVIGIENDTFPDGMASNEDFAKITPG